MRTLANSRDSGILARRLRNLSATDLGLWGRMTAHQMLCHLADSFLLGLGRKTASPATGFFGRAVVKPLALYAPLQWPRGIPTRPEVEQGRGGTPPGDFACDCDRVLDVLNEFANDVNLARQPHPIFGSMSRSDWLRWGYLHTDHHLRQFGR